MRLALSVVLVASTASADPLPTIDSKFPPTIRVIDKAFAGHSVTSVAIEPGEITWLSLSVERAGLEQELGIDLPAGTRVVGMSFDAGDGVIWATQREPLAADHEMREGGGQALAEWAGSSADEDHLTLRITKNGRATFALELPAVASVNVSAAVPIELGGKSRRGPVAFKPTHVQASGPRLGPAMSLLVDPAVPTVDLGVHDIHGSLDKEIIRKYVRRQIPALAHCFMLVAQRTRNGYAAMLHFTIGDTGSTSEVSADIDDTQIRTCLEAEIAAWEFPESHDTFRTQVNYPLRLEVVEP